MTPAGAEAQTRLDSERRYMTDTRRRTHSADPDRVEVREPTDADDSDGLFRIRMPVSSTLEARDGEAFDRDRLEGWVRQIDAGDVGVFLDHGRNVSTGSRYSALGKLGYWADAAVEARDEGAELVADAVLMDPAELDADLDGDLRAALETLRAQAEAGIPLASSVGWAEETGDRDLPGDSDLLEISIVGIPSDPNTTTATADEPALARAVAAASDGFDPETFVAAYRDAITAEDVQDATPVAVDGHAPDTSERQTIKVGDEEIDVTPPERVQNAVALGLAAKKEFDDEIGDCGTGVGENMGQAILDDNLTAEILLNGGEIADSSPATYLESHESDLDADGPPSEWSEEDWTGGCAEVQQALWGFYAEWFADKEAEIREAMEDADDGDRNLEDPEFAEGDAVRWSWQGEPVHGRVAGVHEQYTPPEASEPITGDEGEAVYSIYEWDDSLEPPRFQNSPGEPNTAKPQSSLNESDRDMPPATEENFDGGEEDSVSSDTDEPDEGTDRDEQPDLREMEDDVREIRAMCERMEERMDEMHEKMMGDSDEESHGDEEEDDEEEDDEDDDAEGENSTTADDGDERMVTVDGEEMSAREAIADLREQVDDAEPADPETTDRAQDDDNTADDDASFGFAGMEES